MKSKLLATLILSLCLPAMTNAQPDSVNTAEKSTEKVEKERRPFKAVVVEKSHNVKRAVKKGAHKIQEMACRKDDQECNNLKEKHRAQEQAEYYRDKLTEAQDYPEDAQLGP